CCLSKRPCRYAELRHLVPGVSDKMLSYRLRSMVEQGLVVRQSSNDHPRVQSYALSDLGQSLGEVLQDLSAWAHEHAAAFGVQRVGTWRVFAVPDGNLLTRQQKFSGAATTATAPRDPGRTNMASDR